MGEIIKCKCEKCGVDYEKPATFKKWNEENKNVFFRWSLAFCDKCRREKEREALKALPNILSVLAENFNKKDLTDEANYNKKRTISWKRKLFLLKLFSGGNFEFILWNWRQSQTMG